MRAAGRLTRIQVQDRVTGSDLDALLTCYQRSPCLTNRNPASSSCRISPAGSSVVRDHGLMGKISDGRIGRGRKNHAEPSWASRSRNSKLLDNTTEAAGQFTKRHNVPGLIWSCRIFVWGQEAKHHQVLEWLPPKWTSSLVVKKLGPYWY